jgi:hypothetical protein
MVKAPSENNYPQKGDFIPKRTADRGEYCEVAGVGAEIKQAALNQRLIECARRSRIVSKI